MGARTRSRTASYACHAVPVRGGRHGVFSFWGPCLVPQTGEEQIRVLHCRILFLFGNNYPNID
jgi:hypothetical protein